MPSRSWSIGSSRSRARRATLLPLLEAERRRLRGAAVPRFALTVCCGFAGLRLVERRRLTLSPPWASPPPGGRPHPSTAAGGLCSTAKINARRSELGQTRSFGDIGSMSGLPESGHAGRFMSTRPAAKRNRGTTSLRLQSRRLQHLRPFLDIGAQIFIELGGSHHQRHRPLPVPCFPHVGAPYRLVDFGIEHVDD